MIPRQKVLFVSSPDPNLHPESEAVVTTTVGVRHDLRRFDYGADLASQFADVDVVLDLGGSFGTREMLHAARSVKLWQVLGTGLDHFDLGYWREQGMPVAYCPGPLSAVALGECAMMFILMLARKAPLLRPNVEAGRFYQPVGLELQDRSLLLVGFGASARYLALLAKAFGMRILAVDIAPPSPEEADAHGVEYAGTPADLDDLLPKADFVSLHLPLNADTHHTLDARRMALMKPTSYIVNVARGALVDEDALADNLTTGRLAGAAVDVFSQEPVPPDSPLLACPNMILAPHIAGGTNGTARRRAGLALENCDRIAQGLEPLHRVA